jgi:hypothetical protein
MWTGLNWSKIRCTDRILEYRPEPSGLFKDGKHIEKIMDYQLLVGQAAALASPVNVQFSERKETSKDGGAYVAKYAKCVPVEICISRIFY